MKTTLMTMTFLLISLLLIVVYTDDEAKINTKTNTKTANEFIKDTSLCDFTQGKCENNVAGITVGLMINPVTTPSEKPLTIELMFSSDVTNVNYRLEGRDMFMGVIPGNVSSSDNKLFTGELIYGSCSSNYMVWRMFVNFEYQQQTYTLLYDFLADAE